MGASKQRKATSKQDRAAAAEKAAETGADAPRFVNSNAGNQFHRHNAATGKIKKKRPRVSMARTKASRRHLAK